MTLAIGQGYTSQVCAGDLAPIPFSFPVYPNADGSIDLVVEIRNSSTGELVQIATYPSHYTVSLAAAPSIGGSVTPVNAGVFASGRTAWVMRKTKAHQEARLSELQKFPALSIEQIVDRLTAQLQDAQRDLGRAVLQPIGEAAQTLQQVSLRTDQLVAFDDAGRFVGSGIPKATFLQVVAIVDDITTVAGIAGDVEQVADIDAEVVVVAGAAAHVAVVSGNVGDVRAVADAIEGGLFAGDRVSFAEMNPAKDGLTDDAAKFLAFLRAVHDRKMKGFVPAGNYAMSFVEDRTFVDDLDIEFHPGAHFIGLPTRQDFPGDGVTTSFTVTVWQKYKSFHVVHIASSGAQTVLTEGAHFTAAGQTVNLAAGSSPFGAPASGDTIRVVDSAPMFNLGAATRDSCGVRWVGGFFDNSERGFADSIDSGTALILQDFRPVLVRDGHYWASDDYETARAEGRGDSGIVTISCSNVEISGNILEGQPDLGIYGSGDNDSGPNDDGFQFSVHSNTFWKCSGGVSVKRAGQGVAITSNTFAYAYIGASLWPAGGNAVGARGVVVGNTFWRTGRTAIDCRNSNAPIVANNRIIDFGKKLDGTTTIADVPCAIKSLGCTNPNIHHNVIKLDAWAKDNQVGVQLGKEVTFASNETVNGKVQHNDISGLSIACLETNAGSGNVWRDNHLLNNDTDMSVPATRRWHYWKSNVEYEGIGTTPFEGTFTPTVLFAGASVAPTITYSMQQGRYVRRGNQVWEFVKIQFQYSGGTMSANQLRIAGSPWTSKNTSGQDAMGQLGYFDGALTPPANTMWMAPKRTANSTQVRLEAMRSTGGPTIITNDNIAASTSLRLEYTLHYELNPEAQN